MKKFVFSGGAVLRFSLISAVFFYFFCMVLFPAFAQEEDISTAAGASYLIPQTIFVGDRGRLVVPLKKTFTAAELFVRSIKESTESEGGTFFQDDLVITRLELEQRSGNPDFPSRLLIDFIPYAPGRLSFPPITIPAAPEPVTITGLRITVASILEPQDASLAESAAPLAAPGTGFIIYGSLAALLLLLILGIAGALLGRRHFSFFREHFRRLRLLRAMERFLRRLGTENSSGEDHQQELFSILSGEFREFLSLFTGENCRVLTPDEFRELRLLRTESLNESVPAVLSGNHIAALFYRWELLRFSGSPIGQSDVRSALEELHAFIGVLYLAEREAGKARARSGLSLRRTMQPPAAPANQAAGSTFGRPV